MNKLSLSRPFRRAGVVLAALLGTVVSLEAGAAVESLPREKAAGVASYVTGGVSIESSQAFRKALREYPLAIQLFEKDGARDVYTADAQVRIVDQHGKTVLDQRAEGPFMLVRLPAGDYRVSAELAGRSLAPRQVHVSDHGHADSVFVFPAHTG